jgi:hypothetical protein
MYAFHRSDKEETMRKAYVLGLALAVAASTLFADDPKKGAADTHQAEMEAMMKAAMPGAAHKALDAMVGKWDTTVKSWMEPGQPAMETKGTTESSWVLGGRFVEQKFSGTFMNQPFHGIGFIGYDNVKKAYVSSWIDSMSTAMMVSTGKADEGGKAYTFTSTMADPMTGNPTEITEKVKVVDNDHHTFEMWIPGPDGKPVRIMEITYSRMK